jgi:hypothetical protein
VLLVTPRSSTDSVSGLAISAYVVGPHVIQDHLGVSIFDPHSYSRMSLYICATVRFEHDSVPGLEWFGRGGPIVWPPRSSGFKRLNFYFWGA